MSLVTMNIHDVSEVRIDRVTRYLGDGTPFTVVHINVLNGTVGTEFTLFGETGKVELPMTIAGVE